MRLELYQPPLVDKNKVDNMNSLYMKFQTSLCEREYNIKFDNTVDTDDNDGDDLEKNKLNKKNKSHRNLYDKNQDLSKYNEKKKLINKNFDSDFDEKKCDDSNIENIDKILILNINKNNK